jgi:transposase
MLRSGARWRDCPAEYGPYTTIYNRFNRWSRQGIWHALFEALTGESGIYSSVANRRDCQEFRVRAGIVGMKEISHGPTQGCSNT